jgi:hypothetical protein
MVARGWGKQPADGRVSESPRRALNSAVECHLHTVEVIGSNPVAPTNNINNLRDSSPTEFLAFCGNSAEAASSLPLAVGSPRLFQAHLVPEETREGVFSGRNGCGNIGAGRCGSVLRPNETGSAVHIEDARTVPSKT